MKRVDLDLSSTVRIVPWRDPLIERVGFDACGDYVPLFWLATLGPTATFLIRQLATIVVIYPDGFVLDTRSMALGLGLGVDCGRTSSFHRSIERLALFGLINQMDDHLRIRAVVPPLTLRQLARLPDHLQRAHALWNDADTTLAFDEAVTCGQPAQAPLSAWVS